MAFGVDVSHLPGLFATKPTTPTKTPVQNAYSLYNTNVAQDAVDKTGIMDAYKGAAARVQPNLTIPTNAYTPQMVNYAQSAEGKASSANLRGLAETGGYSDADVANIRERGISPVRAIYANANREVDRNRRLQGGFSPNYNAVKAKMAREMSDQISNQITNVNAGLAQNIASNKLQAAPMWQGATEAEANRSLGVNAGNVNAANLGQQYNLELPLKYAEANRGNNAQSLDAINGMRSLYGTTPASSALFGNSALNTANLQNTMDQQTQTNGLNLIGNAMRGRLA